MPASDQDKSIAADRLYPCQVTFFVDGQQAGQGTSSHFSEQGMLVQCDKPVVLNKRLKLALRFPGIDRPLELQGIVVWTNLHGPADAFTPRGMGIKFQNLDRKVERLLAKLATQYDAVGSMYSCYFS